MLSETLRVWLVCLVAMVAWSDIGKAISSGSGSGSGSGGGATCGFSYCGATGAKNSCSGFPLEGAAGGERGCTESGCIQASRRGGASRPIFNPAEGWSCVWNTFKATCEVVLVAQGMAPSIARFICTSAQIGENIGQCLADAVSCEKATFDDLKSKLLGCIGTMCKVITLGEIVFEPEVMDDMGPFMEAMCEVDGVNGQVDDHLGALGSCSLFFGNAFLRACDVEGAFGEENAQSVQYGQCIFGPVTDAQCRVCCNSRAPSVREECLACCPNSWAWPGGRGCSRTIPNRYPNGCKKTNFEHN